MSVPDKMVNFSLRWFEQFLFKIAKTKNKKRN
jgi:hypothetical protein